MKPVVPDTYTRSEVKKFHSVIFKSFYRSCRANSLCRGGKDVAVAVSQVVLASLASLQSPFRCRGIHWVLCFQKQSVLLYFGWCY